MLRESDELAEAAHWRSVYRQLVAITDRARAVAEEPEMELLSRRAGLLRERLQWWSSDDDQSNEDTA